MLSNPGPLDLQCVVTLAETLSFTETAKRLHMTQPGVTARINRIEKDHGYRLFERTKGMVKAITPEGFIFVEEARQVLEHLDRFQALRLCCHHHCRNRTTTSYSQRPIRPRILTPQRPSCPRYLERCPRCIDQSFSKTSSCPTEIICTRALYSCLWLNGHCRRHQYLSGYVGWPERRRQLCVVRCVREA
jgi:Bacterial regulatory helix-turn-helix protein, lysR family